VSLPHIVLKCGLERGNKLRGSLQRDCISVYLFADPRIINFKFDNCGKNKVFILYMILYYVLLLFIFLFQKF
jgi:hypothetical protein